jgi:hypothetical protein
VMLQVPCPPHVMLQPPPEHARVVVPCPLAVPVHLPPAQLSVASPVPELARVQLPVAHSKVAVPAPELVKAHPAPEHVQAHVPARPQEQFVSPFEQVLPQPENRPRTDVRARARTRRMRWLQVRFRRDAETRTTRVVRHWRTVHAGGS